MNLIINALLLTIAPVLFVYSLAALFRERKTREHYTVIIAGMILSVAEFAYGLTAFGNGGLSEAFELVHDSAEIALMFLFFIVLREHIHEHLQKSGRKSGK